MRLTRTLTVLACATLAATGLPTVAAHADTSSTLTVVGTSDVSDSNLMSAVIKPGFEAAYPQYTLNYQGKATDAAIAFAKAGTASAMIVHAASLENQFVAGGYSLEPYGRAIFYGDFVLLGPPADPAGVLTNAPHDIVTAYERVAAAGALGQANFVSRGAAPGTTVAEHAVWSLTQGQSLCDVSAANGGGQSPSTTTGACPSTIPYPSWYHVTGLTQAPNVINADVCNYTGGNCYVFTDRGTYDYLVSTGALSTLKEVVRDNSAAARGGDTELLNSFHAYAINPAAFSPAVGATINTKGATALLDWLTSPAAQAAVHAYLAGTTSPPFLPDASPALTASAPAASVRAGKPVSITGTLVNVVKGTPPLAGKTVTLSAIRAGTAGPPVAVATTTTDATGHYAFSYVPTASSTFSVSTAQISQIENASLSPVFGDLLSPASATAGTTTVTGSATITKAVTHRGQVTLTIALGPVPSGSIAGLRISKARPGGSYSLVRTKNVPTGTRSVTTTISLPRGKTWHLVVTYSSTHQFAKGTSPVKVVRVP